MWLVDLNYNFECDWLIELSDNNLASKLVENRSVLAQLQSRKGSGKPRVKSKINKE